MSDGDVDASAPCPADLQRDDQVEAAVADKETSEDDEAAVALVCRPGRQAGQDRLPGQQETTPPSPVGRTSTPAPPTRWPAGPTVITLDNSGKPLPPVVKVAGTAEAPAPAATPGAVQRAPGGRSRSDRRQCDRRFAVRLPQRRRGQIVLRPRRKRRAAAADQGVRAAAADPDRRAAAAQAQRRARRARAAGAGGFAAARAVRGKRGSLHVSRTAHRRPNSTAAQCSPHRPATGRRFFGGGKVAQVLIDPIET